MYIEEFGPAGAPTVLLLHGAGVKDTFCHQLPQLSGRYHVLLPHLPGAGLAAAEVYDPDAALSVLLALVDGLPAGKLAVVGHSLGAQLAVRLTAARPQRLACTVFCSAWVNPCPAVVRAYCRMAGACAGMMHWRWLVRLQGAYWHFSKEQAQAMAEDAARLTAEGYRAFFAHTLALDTVANYEQLALPMLALCGSGEVGDMKTSLTLLERNPHCQTRIVPGSHDYPMRRPEILNLILTDYLAAYL